MGSRGGCFYYLAQRTLSARRSSVELAQRRNLESGECAEVNRYGDLLYAYNQIIYLRNLDELIA